MTIPSHHAIAHVAEVADLNGLALPALEALQKLGRWRDLADGQTVQLQGDVVRHVVLVMEGTLMVGCTHPDGRCHLVRPIGPGEFLNLLPAFDQGPAIHDAYASGQCKIMLFEVKALNDLVAAQPGLQAALLRLLYRRNRQLYAELADIAFMSLRQRCASLLLQLLHSSAGARSSEASNEVNVSQTELAQMLGFTRPVVNRELRRLSAEGILEIRYLRVRVLKPDALRAIAVTSGG